MKPFLCKRCGFDLELAPRHTCVSPTTPAQRAKSLGLKNLTQVSKMTGVSLQTLTNWHRDKPRLFSVVLTGCMAEIDRAKDQ